MVCVPYVCDCTSVKARATCTGVCKRIFQFYVMSRPNFWRIKFLVIKNMILWQTFRFVDIPSRLHKCIFKLSTLNSTTMYTKSMPNFEEVSPFSCVHAETTECGYICLNHSHSYYFSVDWTRLRINVALSLLKHTLNAKFLNVNIIRI